MAGSGGRAVLREQGRGYPANTERPRPHALMALKISLKVVPRSSRNAIVGWTGEALKVCVTAAPERGKANAAVEEVIADALGVSRSSVRVVAGHVSPHKIVEVDGISDAEARRRLPAPPNIH